MRGLEIMVTKRNSLTATLPYPNPIQPCSPKDHIFTQIMATWVQACLCTRCCSDLLDFEQLPRVVLDAAKRNEEGP